MKIGQLLTSIGLGASIFFNAQEIRADEPAVELVNQQIQSQNNNQIPSAREFFNAARNDLAKTSEEEKQFFESLQNKTFEIVLNLQETRAKEIAEYLNELRNFYKENLPGKTPNTLQARRELISKGGPQIALLIGNCVKDFTGNDLQKQQIALNNLIAINKIYPWDEFYYGDMTERNKNVSLFFDETLQTTFSNTGRLESLINAGFILIALSGNNTAYMEKFIQWLDKEVDNAIEIRKNNEAEGVQKEKILEKAIQDLTSELSFNFTKMPYSMQIELATPLLRTYTKLAKENISDVNFLNRGIEIVIEFTSLQKNNFPHESLATKEETNTSEIFLNDLSSLFDLLIDGVTKLPDPENKFKNQVFRLLKIFFPNDPQKMDTIISYLSNHYFKQNPNDTEWLMNFTHLVYEGDDFRKAPYIRLPLYLVLKLVKDNPDFFTKNVQKIIKTFEVSNKPEEQLNAMTQLRDLFCFFSILPYLRNTPNPFFDLAEGLETEITNWSSENIQKPICSAFLKKLKTEQVTVEVKVAQKERLIQNRSWQGLNKSISTMIACDPEIATDFLLAINSRLKKDKDPYIREMDYETIGSVLTLGFLNEKVNFSDCLLAGITNEEPLETIRGLGKTISCGITYEVERERRTFGRVIDYDNFFNVIEDYSERKLTLEELSKLYINFTPQQCFILDLIRLTDWDFDLYKTLFPDRTFNERADILFAREIQHRAFLAFAYSASELPNHALGDGSPHSRYAYQPLAQSYKKIAMNILEKQIGMYSTPETWGEEALSFIQLSCTIDNPGKQNADLTGDKLNFLRELFFSDGGLFKRLEAGLLTLEKERKKKNSLSEDEEKKVKEEVSRIRELFAENFLNHAPGGSMQKYCEYLGKMDSKYQSDKIVAKLLGLPPK